VVKVDAVVDEMSEIIAILSSITAERWFTSIVIVDSPVEAPTARTKHLYLTSLELMTKLFTTLLDATSRELVRYHLER